MPTKFLNLPLPKQLFFIFLAVLGIIFIKEILLIAAIILLVSAVYSLVWSADESGKNGDDQTLF